MMQSVELLVHTDGIKKELNIRRRDHESVRCFYSAPVWAPKRLEMRLQIQAAIRKRAQLNPDHWHIEPLLPGNGDLRSLLPHRVGDMLCRSDTTQCFLRTSRMETLLCALYITVGAIKTKVTAAEQQSPIRALTYN